MSVTLVTGGGSGIGRAVALRAAGGGPVAVVDRDGESAEAVSAEIAAAGGQALALTADVADEVAVAAAFERSREKLGTARRIFVNAGIERNAPLHEMSYETWSAVLGTNLNGAFLTCRKAVVGLLEARLTGSIVCTSSPAAFVGFSAGGNGAYAASKGGISALVRSLALDYASDGIRVNAVVPGATDTPMMWSQFPVDALEKARGDVAERAREQVPMQRLGAADEVAAAVCWLLSDDASYVTGSHLVCDGGLLAKSSNTF